MDSPQAVRARLRQDILSQRAELSIEKRALYSEQIKERLRTLFQVQESYSFFVYCDFRSEVVTRTFIDYLLKQGKLVSVPLTEPETVSMRPVHIMTPAVELVPGYKGIREPIASLLPDRLFPPHQIDVAVIPGVVFDRRGFRLGYGGGYYDRFLMNEAPQALRIGVAYSLQVVAQLPALTHDIPMDILVTENEVLSWPRDVSRLSTVC